MSLMIVTALMMAQAPAAVQPAVPQPQATKKVKPKQICEELEITGSRAKRQVCHNADSNADLSAYGVSDSAYGKAKVDGYGTGSTAPTPH